MGERNLYIALLSIHGLIRGRDPELGRDADTGGQVTYVLELARALGQHPDVAQVDLLTRLIDDPNVSADYGRPEEALGERARIVRLPFGPRRYLRKELLWRHLDQLVDRCLEFFHEQGTLPDLIHSHYADAAYVGMKLSQSLAIPQIHTGHSLGRVKRERLLAAGRKASALERQFNFERRIAAEEAALEHASLIVASTHQEIHDQYSLYERLDTRRATVIAPGAGLSRFAPPAPGLGEAHATALVDRFLESPEKALILALCRPVEQKNVRRLLAAYAEDPELRDMANLAIVSGSRVDVRTAEEDQRRLFTDLLLDLDAFDLYGKVAIPKRHGREDVPELYRLAARRRGVFVDVAVNEPFGLTILEAAASGLPVVATHDGGPKEIVESCANGVLVDPLDTRAIAAAVKRALRSPKEWRSWARSGLLGVARHYTWEGHVSRYLRAAKRLLHRERKQIRRRIAYTRPDASAHLRPFRYALITDIDETLVGGETGLESLQKWLSERREDVVFGVATGRVLGLAIGVLEEWRVQVPDVLVSAVGAEIHYGPNLVPDIGWSRHIRQGWRREALEEALAGVSGLAPQPDVKQGPFKLSYDVEPGRPSPVAEVEMLLCARGLHARLVYSQGAYLDLLPVRASKGLALRYLAYKHGVPLRSFLVAGDSGNDTEMLVGDTLAVVVGNHKPELEPLRESDQVYFARRHFADGILEGIAHYRFAGEEPVPSSSEPSCSVS